MRFSTGALATDGSWRTTTYQRRFSVVTCYNSQDTADVMRSSRTMLATWCAATPSCAAVKDGGTTESRETMTESWRRELRASALPQSALVLASRVTEPISNFVSATRAHDSSINQNLRELILA